MPAMSAKFHISITNKDLLYLKGFIPSPGNHPQLLYASHCALSQIVMSYSSWLGKSPDTFNRVSNANNDQRAGKGRHKPHATMPHGKDTTQVRGGISKTAEPSAN